MPKIMTESDGDLDAPIGGAQPVARVQQSVRIPGDGGGNEGHQRQKEPLIEIEEVDEPAQAAGQSEGEGEGDDERLSASQRDPEDRRERNRRWRQENKDRRRQAIQRDKVELEFLRNRNEQLEKAVMAVGQRQIQTEERTITSELGKVQSDLQLADDTLAAAITAGNGGDVVKIQRIRDGLRDRLRDLTTAHTNVRQESQKAASLPATQVPAIHPRAVSYARQFFEDNKDWYDPQGRNEDSAQVLRIDSQLAREGVDPSSDQYWDELEDRVAQALPHRFPGYEPEETTGRGRQQQKNRRPPEEEDDELASRQQPRGPRMAGAAQGRAGVNGRKFKLNAERKQALVDAGVWDDPVLRDKYIRKYMAWDADNVTTSRA